MNLGLTVVSYYGLLGHYDASSELAFTGRKTRFDGLLTVADHFELGQRHVRRDLQKSKLAKLARFVLRVAKTPNQCDEMVRQFLNIYPLKKK